MWNALEKTNIFGLEIIKAQNGDILAPEHRNLFKRARNESPDSIGDIQLYSSVTTRIVLAANNKDDVGDDLNLIVLLLLAELKSPNKDTQRAITYYKQNRPVSYGCYLDSYRKQYGTDFSISAAKMQTRMENGINGGWQNNCPRVLGALRWYFRAETGGNPELAELYEPIIRRWLE